MAPRPLLRATPSRRTSAALLLGFALGLAGPLAGCKPQSRSDTPDQAFRTFAQAVRRGDLERVQEGLSARTKALLEARIRPLSDGGSPTAPLDAVALTFATGVRQAPLDEVKVIRSDAASAVVSVKAGSREGEQRLVLEDGRWKVDLAALLETTDGG